MKLYELSYLISGDLAKEEVEALEEKVNSFIKEEEGILVEVNSAIRRTLAYPIKKRNSAFLVNLSFQLNPEKLENLKKKLKKESKILRYLILAKKIPVAPTPIKKPKIIKKVELNEIEKKLEEILGE